MPQFLGSWHLNIRDLSKTPPKSEYSANISLDISPISFFVPSDTAITSKVEMEYSASILAFIVQHINRAEMMYNEMMENIESYVLVICSHLTLH